MPIREGGKLCWGYWFLAKCTAVLLAGFYVSARLGKVFEVERAAAYERLEMLAIVLLGLTLLIFGLAAFVAYKEKKGWPWDP